MQSFIVKFENTEGFTRSIQIEAASVDSAISKWDLLRQPGDFVVSVDKPCRIQWPD